MASLSSAMSLSCVASLYDGWVRIERNVQSRSGRGKLLRQQLGTDVDIHFCFARVRHTMRRRHHPVRRNQCPATKLTEELTTFVDVGCDQRHLEWKLAGLCDNSPTIFVVVCSGGAAEALVTRSTGRIFFGG